jgi:nitroreductase
MDVIQAINERFAVRAYKSDPVPLDLLKKIIQQALRAPSWANSQPWEFAVATGKPLKAIENGFVKRGVQPPQSDISRPYEFPEPYMSRIRALRPKDRDEQQTKEEREANIFNNYRHYGAPVCIYLLLEKKFYYQSKGINSWSLYDCGSVVQNIMLLATNFGLGTIAQAQAVIYPDIIRKELSIPEDKLIALGIAIGYPDWDQPVNKQRRSREPVDKVAKFYGF